MRERLDAPVLVGVGAAFDFHAGLKKQAPDGLQRLGLEWAFRLSQEPRRLWRRYLHYNPRFVTGFARQYVRHLRTALALRADGPAESRRAARVLRSRCSPLRPRAPTSSTTTRRSPRRAPATCALFIRGRDGALWTRSWNGSAWSGWSSLGGVLTSGPAAIARPGGIYDVVRARHRQRDPPPVLHARAAAGRTGSRWAASSPRPRRDVPPGQRADRRRRHRPDQQLYHKTWEPGIGLVGMDPARLLRRGAPEHHLTGPRHARRLHPRHRQPALPEVLDPVNRLERVHRARRRAVLRRRGDGVGRQPPRRLRPRPRRRVYDRSWTSPGGLAAWARLAGGSAPAPARPPSVRGASSVFARGGTGSSPTAYIERLVGLAELRRRSALHRAAAAPARRPAPDAAPSCGCDAGFGCIPQGGRVPVRVRVYQRTDRLKPRMIKVVFFIDRGKRKRVDRHKPYKTRIRVTFKRGSKHRIHARIYFRRKGSTRVQRKTVSKRFTMCRR